MPLVVRTDCTGTIAVQDQDIITFPRGIIGFEDITSYCLLQRDQGSGLYILQACPEGPAFALLDCRALITPYGVQAELDDLIDLEMRRGDSLQTFVLITRDNSAGTSTLNLKAPLTVNLRSKLGKQVIQWESAYHTKHPLVGEIKPRGAWETTVVPTATRVTVAF
jgi:flagellar assembly factor FliW